MCVTYPNRDNLIFSRKKDVLEETEYYDVKR